MKYYRISHRTEYKYSEPVLDCRNRVHLIPRQVPSQEIVKYHIRVLPKPSLYEESLDYFGNSQAEFHIETHHFQCVVESEFLIKRVDMEFPEVTSSGFLPAYCEEYKNQEWLKNVYPYLHESDKIEFHREILDYALASQTESRSTWDIAQNLMERIYLDFKFVPGSSKIETTPLQTLRSKKGVCQDFSHFMITCLRMLGIPARYVSGYIETIPMPGKEKLKGADHSHAWVSVYHYQGGWKEFDPTNNLIPKDQHIHLGWGRDFNDVSPLVGIIEGGGTQKMKVEVDVREVSSPDVVFKT